MKKLITVLLTAMLFIASSAYADAYSDAYEAYESGNYTQAIKLFKPLALKGDMSAQQNMGYLYASGLGSTQDYAEAVKWYQLAAAQGHPKAQYNLGIAYTNGQGIAQDYIKAHMWFNLLSINGDKESVHYRGEVAKKMTQQQIAEAQKLARECLARKYKGC
jgi:TPR repeat protein